MDYDNGIREKLGRHGEAIGNLKDAVETLSDDVKALKTSVDQARGGWKAASIIGAAMGGVATAIMTYLGLGKH